MHEKIKEPVDILFIDNAIGPGGSYKSMLTLAENIDSQKYRLHIVIPYNWPVPDSVKTKFSVSVVKQSMFRWQSDIRLFSYLLFTINFLFACLPYIIKLYFYSKRHRIRVIHLNNEILCNYGGVILARLLKVPCISHTRGPVKKTLSTMLLARFVDEFIVVSNYIKQYILALGVIEPRVQLIYNGFVRGKRDDEIDRQKNVSKVRIIHDTIRADEIHRNHDIDSLRKELNIPPGTFIFGQIAMLTKWKGWGTLIQAAAGVLKDIPNCAVLVVGGVPTAEKNYRYKEELVNLCKKLGIENKVIFTGHREDVFRFFKLMDIVIHCAILPDPQPGVVIQAMAFGRPMIASRCGGVPELVEDGKSALLIEPGNAAQLQDTIIRLYRDHAKREILGHEARLRFMRKFTLKKEMKKIETLYRMLASRTK